MSGLRVIRAAIFWPIYHRHVHFNWKSFRTTVRFLYGVTKTLSRFVSHPNLDQKFELKMDVSVANRKTSWSTFGQIVTSVIFSVGGGGGRFFFPPT